MIKLAFRGAYILSPRETESPPQHGGSSVRKTNYFKLLYDLNQVCELETRLSEMNKMKDEEESSRKNAEEMIEKLKQESKDKVYIF